MESGSDQTAAHVNATAQQEGATEAQTPAPSELDQLREQVKEKENRYLYLYADFENYKKRAIKERSDLLKYGFEGPVREFLQVCDNLERAIAHASAHAGAQAPKDKTSAEIVEGLKMILNQFSQVLFKQGIRPITALGVPFDPNQHEAIGTEASDQPNGAIIREETKGYMIHDRLLRPSRVVISKGSA